MDRLGCNIDGNLNDAKFSEPLPWIGVYVAAATLVCGLAMGADLIHGFRHRKFWFPCKFFTLNATSLTFIAVAVKLSVDLNTSMPSSHDQLAKLSSTVFICTVIGNSMPSLGAMESNDLLMNIMALGILVITVIVNICIQLGTGAIYVFWKEHAFIMLLMIVMLMILSFSALTVPTTKDFLELKYKKKYELAVKECPSANNRLGVQRIKEDLMKFWMMAHTCSPQFVVGRSVTCTASGFLCLLSALILGEAMLQSYLIHGSRRFCRGDSDYKWSTFLVLIMQTTTIGIGTVAPAMRWFTAVNYGCPTRGKKSSLKEFRVESYWIQSLIESKESPLSIRIQNRRCRKVAHDAKRLVLDCCIALQCGIVLASKVIRYISVCLAGKILLCCDFCKKLKKFNTTSGISTNGSGSESNPSMKPDLTRFVLHLEGEAELVEYMMRSNCKATDYWVEMGKTEKPDKLIELLKAIPLSRGFHGTKEFDSDEVPSLVNEEPPNCWALPLATLTSIAVALPNINPCLQKKLLNGVNEGLFYVKIIDHVLDNRGDMTNIRKAADIVWLGVDLYHKWLDVDLRKMSLQGKTPEEILQELAKIAKERFFEAKHLNPILRLRLFPLRWPVKLLAANSMYRICQTILVNYKTRNYRGSEELFEALQVMIADIISACLCNLQRVISIKGLIAAIEVREASVRAAAFHLGRTEEILEMLNKRCIPEFSPDQMAKIDEWRSFYKLDDIETCTPTTSSESNTSSPASDDISLNVE